jgi:hypothetical protein
MTVHALQFNLLIVIPDSSHNHIKFPRHPANTGLYLSIMATHIGLDAKEDINWVFGGDAMERFIVGETDAFLGFPPQPQELRARRFDRVILNTVQDRPWSQYFCCMIYGNRAWVRDHPIATKRFLRAIYKAADFCTAEPEIAAQKLVDGGFARVTTMRCGPSRRYPTTARTNTIPRTRCGSTRCACMRRGCSATARTRCLPTAPTGAFSTSSSAS